jgi:DNA-binding GntR family transcriptional regulator
MATISLKSPSGAVRVARLSAADKVYEKLKQDIADFRLVPGDRFTENEVGLCLNVSRTPVRQSLYRLQQEGFIEVLFKSGWRVLPFDFEKFEQLYDLRIVLESSAIARLCDATVARTLKEQKRIDALEAIWLVAPQDRSHNTVQVCAWDEHFHCTLVEAAGNAEIARVHKDVTDRIRIIRRLDFTKQGRIDATYEEHAKILLALQHQRSDEAGQLLRAHIATSQSEVRKITMDQISMARQAKNSLLAQSN